MKEQQLFEIFCKIANVFDPFNVFLLNKSINFFRNPKLLNGKVALMTTSSCATSPSLPYLKEIITPNG